MVEYTSLRDILPDNPRPPPIVAPANSSSWDEIPIKNPLVKQAALAYLHATPTPPHVSPNTCSCSCSCVDFVNGVLFKAIAHFFVSFCNIRRKDDSEDDGDHGGGDEEEILD